jgi:hypothetical protein
MRVEVEVTQEDVDGGTPASECCCPVALGLRRALGCDVWVGEHQWGILGSEAYPMLVLPTPRSAQAFIKVYDNQLTREDAAPFKFAVEVPEPIA